MSGWQPEWQDPLVVALLVMEVRGCAGGLITPKSDLKPRVLSL